MDFPETIDQCITDKEAEIDQDSVLSGELLPQEFGVEWPAFKLLGYPTDDALNAYSEWYFFDKGINLATPGDKSEFFKEAEKEERNYSLFMQVSLEGLEAIDLGDPYADFGGISIGIKNSDLENRDFTRLQFKYSIS